MGEPSNYAMRELRKAVHEIEVRNQLQFGVETWADLKDAVWEIERFWEGDLNSANANFYNLKSTMQEALLYAEVGADGHDEINEHTPDAYISLLETRINNIEEVIRNALQQFQ